MSLVTPTYFSDYYWRDGQINNTIVKLVQGADTYYLSQTDMQIGAVHVHGLLEKHGGIKEEINVMSKTWKISSVKLTFTNLPFIFSTTGVKQRLSDVLFNIRGSEAIIYLQAGKTIPTDIETNCLERFKGIVALEPTYDDEQLVIQLTEKLVFDDVTIPKTIMSSVFSKTPSELANDVIPLVFGKFTIVGDDDVDFDFTGNGLAIALPTGIDFPPKLVVSDHTLNSITNVWIKEDGFIDLGYFTNPTKTIDDSGRGTIVPNAEAYLYLYPQDNDDTGLPTSIYGSPANPENAYDRDIATYATVLDSVDGGGGLSVSHAGYRINNMANLITLMERGINGVFAQGKITSQIGAVDDVQIRMVTIGAQGTYVDFTYGASWFTCVSFPAGDIDGSNNFTALQIRLRETAWGSADSIDDNFLAGMMWLYSVRLRVSYDPMDYITPRYNTPVVVKVGPGQKDYYGQSSVLKESVNLFIDCEGLEYDSDITGRSSNYADGDVIEDPAGIIEWLLRTQLSYVDDDIDLTTFIDAENTNVKMRMNLYEGNKASITSIIKQICEQSTFTFFMSAVGKVKLIPLNNQSPTTTRIIKHSQLVKGKVKLSKLSAIVETINVKSRYQQEYGGIFRDYETFTNTGADGVVYDANWPNIAGTSAQHVARHLVKKIDGTDSNDDGLWANEHHVVELETFGFINADLQVGDWIELEAASFDDQLQAVFPTTTSWASQQFLVTTVIQKLDTTYIKAIHLFEDIP